MDRPASNRQQQDYATEDAGPSLPLGSLKRTRSLEFDAADGTQAPAKRPATADTAEAADSPKQPKTWRRGQKRPAGTTEPLFLTNKLKIRPLGSTGAVHDFQLREHFVGTENLYTLVCGCTSHKHGDQPCRIVTTTTCGKCATPTASLIGYQELLFHPQLSEKLMARCCRHTHTPPCGRCPNCSVGTTCVVTEPFECDITTEAVCQHGDGGGGLTLTRSSLGSNMALHEHIYNTRQPTFYFCKVHRHRHKSHPEVDCYIWRNACCDQAVSVEQFPDCFIVHGSVPKVVAGAKRKSDDDAAATASTSTASASTLSSSAAAATTTDPTSSSNVAAAVATKSRSTRSRTAAAKAQAKKAAKANRTVPAKEAAALAASFERRLVSWTIFSPRIWRDQAFNYFMSFIRACISAPDAADERYKRFAASTFQIPLKAHISGKDSFMRSSVTGFNAEGVYQTSTISCTQRPDVLKMPHNIYDMLNEVFDLDMGATKRDPSIQQTCLAVLALIRHWDPSIPVTTISDLLAKGFNQDQDGDRNAIYLIRLLLATGFTVRGTYKHALGKFERACAFAEVQTLISTPRHRLSEVGILNIFHHPEVFMHLESFRRMLGKPPAYLDEAYAGYYRGEQSTLFHSAQRQFNRTKQTTLVGAADLLGEGNRITGIVDSGAKGNHNLVDMLLRNLGPEGGRSLTSCYDSMLTMNNAYIASSQDLSRNGRKQFAVLFAAHDLVMVLNILMLNGVALADFIDFACAGLFLYNQATLDLSLSDLIRDAIDAGLFDDLPELKEDALRGLSV